MFTIFLHCRQQIENISELAKICCRSLHYSPGANDFNRVLLLMNPDGKLLSCWGGMWCSRKFLKNESRWEFQLEMKHSLLHVTFLLSRRQPWHLPTRNVLVLKMWLTPKAAGLSCPGLLWWVSAYMSWPWLEPRWLWAAEGCELPPCCAQLGCL